MSYTAGSIDVPISRFNPEFLLLTACKAGQSLPTCKLFGVLNDLKEVYASPNNLHRDQAYILLAIIYQLLAKRKMDNQLPMATQLLNFGLTNGVLFKWTRDEFRPGMEIHGSCGISPRCSHAAKLRDASYIREHRRRRVAQIG
jgi:hypothetical protein